MTTWQDSFPKGHTVQRIYFTHIKRHYGPRHANLVLIAYASSEGSGEPAHPRSLTRTSCSLIQAVRQEEPSNRKPDAWPFWMAGHARLKSVMTECLKTQICLMRHIIRKTERTMEQFFSCKPDKKHHFKLHLFKNNVNSGNHCSIKRCKILRIF